MVDVQNDFMFADGALYVPNAENIISNIVEVVKKLKENDLPIIATADKHYGLKDYAEVETELQVNGGPFPDHCMNGTPGGMLIGTLSETIGVPRKIDDYHSHSFEDVIEKQSQYYLKVVLSEGVAIFTKQTYDAFRNRYFARICKIFDEFIVFGVATDFCVYAVVDGLMRLGKKVTLITDAIAGVDKAKSADILLQFQKDGVVLIKTEDFLKGE